LACTEPAHIQNGLSGELGAFRQVMAVDFEHFDVSESAFMVKVFLNWPEFFRV